MSEIKTRKIHLDDLRPCHQCGEAMPGGIFYIIKAEMAIISKRTAQEFMGMNMYFGGGQAPALAAIFTPSAGEAAEALPWGEETFLCGECAMKVLPYINASEDEDE